VYQQVATARRSHQCAASIGGSVIPVLLIVAVGNYWSWQMDSGNIHVQAVVVDEEDDDDDSLVYENESDADTKSQVEDTAVDQWFHMLHPLTPIKK
jgi:hypothetical protein